MIIIIMIIIIIRIIRIIIVISETLHSGHNEIRSRSQTKAWTFETVPNLSPLTARSALAPGGQTMGGGNPMVHRVRETVGKWAEGGGHRTH